MSVQVYEGDGYPYVPKPSRETLAASLLAKIKSTLFHVKKVNGGVLYPLVDDIPPGIRPREYGGRHEDAQIIIFILRGVIPDIFRRSMKQVADDLTIAGNRYAAVEFYKVVDIFNQIYPP